MPARLHPPLLLLQGGKTILEYLADKVASNISSGEAYHQNELQSILKEMKKIVDEVGICVDEGRGVNEEWMRQWRGGVFRVCVSVCVLCRIAMQNVCVCYTYSTAERALYECPLGSHLAITTSPSCHTITVRTHNTMACTCMQEVEKSGKGESRLTREQLEKALSSLYKEADVKQKMADVTAAVRWRSRSRMLPHLRELPHSFAIQ